ncbi:TLDc domain-containing protein [Entamoeba marina]
MKQLGATDIYTNFLNSLPEVLQTVKTIHSNRSKSSARSVSDLPVSPREPTDIKSIEKNMAALSQYDAAIKTMEQSIQEFKSSIGIIEDVLNNLKGIVAEEDRAANVLKTTANKIIDSICALEKGECNKAIMKRYMTMPISKEIKDNKRNQEELEKQKLIEMEKVLRIEAQRIEKDEQEKIRNEMESVITERMEKFFKDEREKKQDEIMPRLNQSRIVYDTATDEQTNIVFNKHVMNIPNLFFFNFDENGNVFGIFMSKIIDEVGIRINDDQNYVFSLEASGRVDTPHRWFIKEGQQGGILLYERDKVFSVVTKLNLKKSRCNNLSETYQGISDLDLSGLNGSSPPQWYSVQRIVVVEMFN